MELSFEFTKPSGKLNTMNQPKNDKKIMSILDTLLDPYLFIGENMETVFSIRTEKGPLTFFKWSLELVQSKHLNSIFLSFSQVVKRRKKGRKRSGSNRG